jgi:spore maturation protein CgeB
MQLKSRIWEALLCGSLLMDNESDLINRYLEPMTDYVPYRSIDDLENNIRYYLSHIEELNMIRLSGREKARRLCDPRSFWTTHLGINGVNVIDG